MADEVKEGRPTIMTELTVKKLEDAFSVGASDVEACFLAEISKQTLYNYQKENPEFVDRKEALKEMQKFKAKKVVEVALKQNKIETAQWLLERKGKDEGYSQRQEITGANGKDLIPVEEVKKRLENLKKL